MIGVMHPAFVGRASELRWLRAAFERAAAGQGATVIVSGPAGIGKTRLVEEFVAQARAGDAHVLEGSCLKLGEGSLPYGPFVEALRDLVRGSERDAMAALLGAGRAELARLLPELVDRSAGPPQPPGAPGTAEQERLSQARLFEFVLQLLERLSRSAPLVLVVEGLQWADPSTRDLLHFLVRSLRRHRVLIVVTLRSDEVDQHHPLLPLLAELGRMEHVERLELGPLQHAEVVALLTSIPESSFDDGLIASIVERSEGSPFFAEQLLAAAVEGSERVLPPRLRDVLVDRVAGLSGTAQEVLRAASAGGRAVDDRLLATVLAMEPETVTAALREMVSRGILVPVAAPNGEMVHRFQQGLLQEVVYTGLFAGERRRLHARYAQVLAAAVRSDALTPSAAELAYHWDAAQEWASALPAFVDAGLAAERVYAFADALRLYERALELWDRPHQQRGTPAPALDRVGVLQRAAECACLTAEFDRAIEFGREALRLVEASGDQARAGLIHERLRWHLWESGDHDAAMAAILEADRLVPAHPPSAARARILGHMAGVDMLAGRYRRSLERARSALYQAQEVGAAIEEALATGIVGWDTAILGDVEGGVRRLRGALAIARSVGNVEGVGLGYATLASLMDLVGRTDEMLAVAREGREEVRGLGLAGTYGALLSGTAAAALLALGRWDEAGEELRAGLEREPSGRPAIWLHLNRARLETGRGAFDAAAASLQLARAADDRLRGTEYRFGIAAASAELAVWQDRRAEGRAIVNDAFAQLTGGTVDPALGWLAALGLRVEADAAELARARHDEEAEQEARQAGDELAERLLDLAQPPDGDPTTELAAGMQARLEALASLCAAELARLEGSADGVEWAEVARRWTDLGRPFPAAYAAYRQAAAILARRGSRQEASEPLRSAHATALRLGAAPLQREIELLARHARLDLAAGPDSRRPEGEVPTPGDPLGLTPREREVLLLLAGGWTNQQIADALFITRKTASVHVSNILGKLGVDSRVEAAAIAHRLGLAAESPPPPDAGGSVLGEDGAVVIDQA